ncbi:MAG: glycosyltransferase [Crocinitomix sp.]|nr:glycosyltransferase [Crocinitomix sp.]
MNPLVSIVVPVYNAGEFLAETITSVLKQSYTNWNLHLVDDGSTDNSAEIIAEFQKNDDRIHYHYKENGGQASARNYGIHESKGTYIAFLDADDLWLKHKLTEQIKELETYNPDFLYGLGYYYYPEKDPQLESYDWLSGKMTGNAFFKALYHSCAVNTNTVLVKKSFFQSVGYFDESELLRGTEDWDLWMRIAKKADTIYGSPTRNVYYRIHADGIHLQHTRMLIGKLNIYEKYDRDVQISRLMRKREYRYHYRELFNHLHADGRSAEIPEQFKKLKQIDPWGFGTFWQKITLAVASKKRFIWISNKIIYRLAYRIERMNYALFLKDDQ